MIIMPKLIGIALRKLIDWLQASIIPVDEFIREQLQEMNITHSQGQGQEQDELTQSLQSQKEAVEEESMLDSRIVFRQRNLWVGSLRK